MFKIIKKENYIDGRCDNCSCNKEYFYHIYCDDTDLIKLCKECIKELKKILK